MTSGTAKAKLVMDLRAKGIRDMRVLEALETTPRELFVSDPFVDQAYLDQSLPISCGQTISQPFIVAFMTEQLGLGERAKVLEIGTGSGYQSAVLSKLCRRVYTIERYRTLSMQAQTIFEKLALRNITTLVGDGYRGWPQQAPFDHIIVTAAAPDIPQALADQLSESGVMVIPVNEGRNHQALLKVERDGDSFKEEKLMSVRFVPMVAGIAREKLV
ncbi:MAG TPA: protein-L-isoaspartate(D-aspartate) O-methyltransferase [Rhizobiales bacterium]|nr:protein-L-isoaspartate(D-aspartate) O-methyltransferase [Hyphomicrobiales bacterium]